MLLEYCLAPGKCSVNILILQMRTTLSSRLVEPTLKNFVSSGKKYVMPDNSVMSPASLKDPEK